MSRYIDADKLDAVVFQGKSEEFIDGAMAVLKMIDEMPTEQIQSIARGKWIPISERLPEEYVPVMVSTDLSVFPEARYSKKYGWEWAAYAADGDWLWINNIVTAWMPLPEPYKESEEEDG